MRNQYISASNAMKLNITIQRGNFVWLFATRETNTKKQNTALTRSETNPNITRGPLKKPKGKATSTLPFPLLTVSIHCITTVTIKHRLQIKANFEKKRMAIILFYEAT
jgi:hypothetical protein